MTDKEFGIILTAKLREIDDTCSYCIYSPTYTFCTNTEVGDLQTCYEGMKAFAEKEKKQ